MLRRVKEPKNKLTSQEIHALVEGFCEVLCPWPPRYHSEHPGCHSDPERSEGKESQSAAISQEYHYYLAGRALGVIAWLIIAKIVQEVFF